MAEEKKRAHPPSGTGAGISTAASPRSDQAPPPELPEVDVNALSTKELKKLIRSAKLKWTDCVEKEELRARAREAYAALASRDAAAPRRGPVAGGGSAGVGGGDLSLEIPESERFKVSELPMYKLVEPLSMGGGADGAALVEHAKRAVCRLLPAAEIRTLITLQPFAQGETPVFYKDDPSARANNANYASAYSRQVLSFNKNARLGESKCPELWLTLETTQMSNLGAALAARVVAACEASGGLAKSAATAPLRLADAAAALMLVTDAYLADEKGDTGSSMKLIGLMDWLAPLADLPGPMAVPVPAGPPGDPTTVAVGLRTSFEVLSLILAQSAIKKIGVSQVQSMFDHFIAEDADEHPHLRCRVRFLSSYCRLMGSDHKGAARDLDKALAAYPDQDVLHTQIIFAMRNMNTLYQTSERAVFRRGLLKWLKSAHPDNRDFYVSCCAAAAIFMVNGTVESLAEGRKWFDKGKVAERRRNYLYGEIEGGWEARYDPVTMQGLLVQLAHDAYDWDGVDSFDAATLKRKYTTMSQHMPPALIKQCIRGVRSCRANGGRAASPAVSSSKAPTFAIGDAVVLSPSRTIGCVRSVPTKADPMYGVMVRGDAADKITKYSPDKVAARKDPPKCPLCFEALVSEPVRLECTHEFCVKCLHPTGMMATKSARCMTDCPLCRAPLSLRDRQYVTDTVAILPVTIALEKYTERERARADATAGKMQAEIEKLTREGKGQVEIDLAAERLLKESMQDRVRPSDVDEDMFGGLRDGDVVLPSERILLTIQRAGTDLALNDSDAFGDGDQSLVGDDGPGSAVQALRDAWSDGMDVMDSFQTDTWPPGFEGESKEFAYNCLLGHHSLVKDMIDATVAGSTARTQLLERRLSLMRFPPLLLTIAGERTVSCSHPDPKADHFKVVEHLVAAGARVNPRDVVGCTAIFHCCSTVSTPTGHRMARFLASHGADPNTPSRFGSRPLHEAIMSMRADNLSTLLSIGANIELPDATGLKPSKMRLVTSEMRQCMQQHRKNSGGARGSSTQGSAARGRAPNASANQCGHCGNGGCHMRCTRCSDVFYCNRDCQKADYKLHKKVCVAVLPAKKKGSSAK